MNNYCIYLKLKTKKYKKYKYCKNLNKFIDFLDCKNCPFKEYKKIKQKRDKNMVSIMPPNELYSTKKIKYFHKHHVYGGRNRNNSERLGFFVWVSPQFHLELTNHPELNLYLQKIGQAYFEKHLGTRSDFIKIFGENFIYD